MTTVVTGTQADFPITLPSAAAAGIAGVVQRVVAGARTQQPYSDSFERLGNCARRKAI